MYICNTCDTVFDVPHVSMEPNSNGEHRWFERFETCPICGNASWSTVDDCPRCDGYKLSKDILCRPCRQALQQRFAAFADELLPAELEQLDRWLDGDSISHRRNWT